MFNKQESIKLAEKIKGVLVASTVLGLTESDVNLNQDSDGSVEVTILKGKIVTSGTEGATPKNISAAIDKIYTETRSKGNTFTQPVSGIFTVAVKAKAVNESTGFRKFLAEGIYGGKDAIDANKDNLGAFKKAITKAELLDLIKDETEEQYITRGGNDSAHDFKVETEFLYLVFTENKDGKVNARVDSLVSFLLDDPSEAADSGFTPQKKSQRYYVPIMYNIDLNKLKLIRAEIDGDYSNDGTLFSAARHIKKDSIAIKY